MSRVISEKKLPCGGTTLRLRFGKPESVPKARLRRMARPITDKRHFAGVKAHDTRLRNQAARLVYRVQRNILLERWKPASKAMLELAGWIDEQFGWGDACKIGG